MGSGPDFGGKPDSVTAGRSSSQGCRVGANGYRIIDTLGQTRTSQAWVRVFCIAIWSWPWAHKFHNLCFTPLLKPWEIPRIPSSWKLKSKITNSSQGQHMFFVKSALTDSTVRLCCSYLFLRMKLLLENLKLCCGTHDMLVPILLGSGGFFARPWKPKCSVYDEWR